MNIRSITLVCSVSALSLFAACSSNAPRLDAGRTDVSTVERQYGNVRNIEVVESSSRGAGGAVLGAVIGAVVGNQIGSGSGRAAATGVGAVGGAIIGNQIQKRNETDVYRVSVRLDNGGVRQFDYSSIGDLRVGDRVLVEGGQLHRV
ncbi:MAG TPA: glycine zipper 2TM domain-containing protein [Burkholderiaceae bacterium]|nr:glycine zipper 2TM domain-containing protein [Burkholderiaceae bacterium]